METIPDTLNNQVCRSDNGQFIAFWRGNIVVKFDRSLRYFVSEQAAWVFLERRDSVSSSIVGIRGAMTPKPSGPR